MDRRAAGAVAEDEVVEAGLELEVVVVAWGPAGTASFAALGGEGVVGEEEEGAEEDADEGDHQRGDSRGVGGGVVGVEMRRRYEEIGADPLRAVAGVVR